jgi:hypothetical protein
MIRSVPAVAMRYGRLTSMTRKNLRRSQIPLALFGAMAAVCTMTAAWHPAAGAATPADIPAIMRLTVDGWVASSQAADFIPYGFNFLADKAIEPDLVSPSNLIRQASSSAALANYFDYTGDPKTRDRLQRTLSAFGRLSLPIGKRRLQQLVEATHILAVPAGRWRLKSALGRFGLLYQTSGDGKVVSPDGSYEKALAGTVALALLTEVVYSHASGDQSFAGLRAAWRDGLLSLRIPGGGFRQDPSSIDDSDYYNGEAWLALAVYGDMNKDDFRSTKALSDLDDALIRRYSEKPSVNFLGWGAMAAAQRYKTTNDPKFLVYLRQLGDAFVARYQRGFAADANNCAAMEGIGAIAAVLKQSGENDTDRARALRAWLSNEVAKLDRLQIQPGQQGLVLGGEAYLRAPRMAEYSGGFLAGIYDPLTRVDAAGHCLSAMVIIERHHLF